MKHMFTLLCHTSFGAPGPVEGLPLPGPTFLKVDFFFSHCLLVLILNSLKSGLHPHLLKLFSSAKSNWCILHGLFKAFGTDDRSFLRKGFWSSSSLSGCPFSVFPPGSSSASTPKMLLPPEFSS